MLYSIGTSTEDLNRLLLNTDFTSLLGNKVPGTFLTKDGQPMLELLQKHIQSHISNYLNSADLSTLTSDQQNQIQLLKNRVERSDPITFKDLGLLRTCFPQDFKKLTITAVKMPSGDIEVFNEHNTPDVEVALACRASAAIPIAMSHVKIPDREGEYIDGGIYDMSPADYFEATQEGHFTNNKKDETLIIAFDENRTENIYEDYINDIFFDTILEKLPPPNESAYDVKQACLIILSEISQTESKEPWPGNIAKLSAALQTISTTDLQRYHIEENPRDFLKKILQDATNKATFKVSSYEHITRNKLMPWLDGLKLPYIFTDRKAEHYKKIEGTYKDRTVKIKLGQLFSGDFKGAQKRKEEIVAMSYLDTFRYLSTQDLVDKPTQQAKYKQTIDDFINIYSKILQHRGQLPEQDAILKKVNALRASKTPDETIIFDYLKPLAEKNMLSKSGFAFARAIEKGNNTIYDTALEEKVRTRASQQSLFRTASNIISHFKHALNMNHPQKPTIPVQKEEQSIEMNPLKFKSS